MNLNRCMMNLKQFCVFLLVLAIIMLANPARSQAQSAKSKDKKPLVVFVTGDHEYSGEETLPMVAAELEKNYGMKTIVLKAYPDHNSEKNIPGLEALKDADLAVFYLRWRQLPFAPPLTHSISRKDMKVKNGMRSVNLH